MNSSPALSVTQLLKGVSTMKSGISLLALILMANTHVHALTMEQEYQESQRKNAAAAQRKIDKEQSDSAAAKKDFEEAVKYQCGDMVYAFLDKKLYLNIGRIDSLSIIINSYKDSDYEFGKTLPYSYNSNVLNFEYPFGGEDTKIDTKTNIQYTRYSDGIGKKQCEFRGGNFNRLK